MKVLLTGSTGMLGQGVLHACLADDSISDVYCVNRSPLTLKHPKIREVLIDDFLDLGAISDLFERCDTFFYCLGTSSSGVSEEDYSRITIDMPLAFASELQRHQPDAVFTYISAEGADKDSKTMWARVKGTIEERLLALGLSNTYIFRPAATFVDNKAIEIRSKNNRWAMRIMGPLYRPIKWLFPNFVCTSTQFADTMIMAAQGKLPFDDKIIGCKQINQVTKP